MTPVKLALNAMATRFELVLHGENETRLRAAGEEAMREVERLEAQLSLYRPGSEIARVNALAARGPARVSPPVFALLRLARKLHEESGGAFDIAMGPLVRCWGFMDGRGRVPSQAEVEEARGLSGMSHVALDDGSCSVRFDREGVMIDLGAIGKGRAIDRAAEILREAGVGTALLHGGTSTVCGIGAPPGADGWKVEIAPAPGQPSRGISVVLRDGALSVSAVWGRCFEFEGKRYGHVIDPRTGRPVNNAIQAAVALESATESDALSTALLVAGLEGHDAMSRSRPEMRTMVMGPAEDGFCVKARGIMVPGGLSQD